MTNAEAWFNIALRSRKPEGSLGRTAQDGHLDCHTAPELCVIPVQVIYTRRPRPKTGGGAGERVAWGEASAGDTSEAVARPEGQEGQERMEQIWGV